MNNNQWRPPHPGQFPHPQANQQMQYCRDCGQYHPIQQMRRPGPQPGFQRSVQPEQQPQPQPGFQQPELLPEQSQGHEQQLVEEQYVPDWDRRVNLVEAITIALEEVPGEAVEAEMKRKHGMLIYEVEIVTQQGVKYEVEVDVNTGNIVTVELD